MFDACADGMYTHIYLIICFISGIPAFITLTAMKLSIFTTSLQHKKLIFRISFKHTLDVRKLEINVIRLVRVFPLWPHCCVHFFILKFLFYP